MTSKALTPVLIVTAILAGGCASASSTSSRGASSARTSATATLTSPISPRSPTQKAFRRRFTGSNGKQRFIAFANTVCRAVRGGAPPPLKRIVSVVAVEGYARAARAAAERTAVSLERVPAPVAARRPATPVITDYQRLIALYAQLAAPGPGRAPPSHLIHRISIAEQRTTADALRGRIAVCAPHAPGVGVVQRG